MYNFVKNFVKKPTKNLNQKVFKNSFFAEADKIQLSHKELKFVLIFFGDSQKKHWGLVWKDKIIWAYSQDKNIPGVSVEATMIDGHTRAQCIKSAYYCQKTNQIIGLKSKTKVQVWKELDEENLLLKQRIVAMALSAYKRFPDKFSSLDNKEFQNKLDSIDFDYISSKNKLKIVDLNGDEIPYE